MSRRLGDLIIGIDVDLSGVGTRFRQARRRIRGEVVGFNQMLSGLGVIGAAKRMYDLAASFDNTKIALRTMTGSVTKANRVIRELESLTRATPFNFEELKDNARLLMAYGIEADKVTQTLKSLGDITAGTQADFGRLALAYGQIRTKGRLYGQEVRQLTENAVPIIEILSKQLGKTATEIREMGEQGKISFKQVEEAIFSMSDAGGQFHNMMEEMSTTLSGTMNRFMNEIDFALRDIGRELSPMLKELTEEAILLTKDLSAALKQIDWIPLRNSFKDTLEAMRMDWENFWNMAKAYADFKMKQSTTDGAASVFDNLKDAYKGYQVTVEASWEAFKRSTVGVFADNVRDVTSTSLKFSPPAIIQRRANALAAGKTLKQAAAEERALRMRWNMRTSAPAKSFLQNFRDAYREGLLNKQFSGDPEMSPGVSAAYEQYNKYRSKFRADKIKAGENRQADDIINGAKLAFEQGRELFESMKKWFDKSNKMGPMEWFRGIAEAFAPGGRQKIADALVSKKSMMGTRSFLKKMQRDGRIEGGESGGFVGFSELGQKIQEAIIRDEEKRLLQKLNDVNDKQLIALEALVSTVKQKLYGFLAE